MMVSACSDVSLPAVSARAMARGVEHRAIVPPVLTWPYGWPVRFVHGTRWRPGPGTDRVDDGRVSGETGRGVPVAISDYGGALQWSAMSPTRFRERRDGRDGRQRGFERGGVAMLVQPVGGAGAVQGGVGKTRCAGAAALARRSARFPRGGQAWNSCRRRGQYRTDIMELIAAAPWREGRYLPRKRGRTSTWSSNRDGQHKTPGFPSASEFVGGEGVECLFFSQEDVKYLFLGGLQVLDDDGNAQDIDLAVSDAVLKSCAAVPGSTRLRDSRGATRASEKRDRSHEAEGCDPRVRGRRAFLGGSAVHFLDALRREDTFEELLSNIYEAVEGCLSVEVQEVSSFPVRTE